VFPERADLATLPSKPPPRAAFSVDTAPVESWTFAQAPLDRPTPYEDSTHWDDLLRRVASRRPDDITLSGSLRCAAVEIARFHAERGSMPSESLQRFTIARCGGTTPEAAALVWSGTADAAISVDAIFERGRGVIESALAQRLTTGKHSVGLGFVRERASFAVVTLIGRDDVQIDVSSLRADASRRVVVRGRLHEEAASVVAVINRGSVGASECETDVRLAMPWFAFTCHLADGDVAAWVQVAVRRKGRVLLTPVADLLLRAEEAGTLVYRAPPSGAPLPVAMPSELSTAILDAVNQARARAGLQPLSLATRQAAENTRLAGTLIDALFERDDAAGDRIALGLLAGWEVDGLIRNGYFYVGRTPTHDARLWIDGALVRPIGRLVLLDGSVRQIAIGPLMPDEIPALGAVVTTYAFFESKDHARDADRFFLRVASTRAARGLPPVTRVLADELTAAVRQVLERDERPMAALDAALRAIASLGPVRVEGLVAETHDLEQLPIPEVLLRPGPLKFAVEITHHRAPGAAWGQLAVFIIIVSPPGSQPRPV
jgi:hypothetical protein